MTAYPAITLWQPWATLVAADCKPFEFRSWPAPRPLWYRRIAIHAAARKPRPVEMRALLVKLHGARAAETGLHRDRAIPLLEAWVRDPSALPLSAILALATLDEPLRNEALATRLLVDACDGFGTGPILDSDRHQHSNWGWPLNDVAPLTPYVPARGQQGWWTWHGPAEALAA